MENLFRAINKKFNGLIWSLTSTGIILLLLAILVVWTDFMVRLVIGLVILLVAYVFLYAGYKIWTLKREIKKYFDIQ